MKERVLVVEDDKDIAQLIAINLREAGFEVDIENSGDRGLNRAQSQEYSLLILDLMLPKLGGLEIVRQIRNLDRSTPILIVTLRSDISNKVLGLELGADDYLTKPFDVEELIARARALVRRLRGEGLSNSTYPENIIIGDLAVDTVRRKVLLSEKNIELSPKQYDLLLFLASNSGRPFSRSDLLNRVWNYSHEGYEHTVDTHINRLRGKIEPNPTKPIYILTVWGVGYKFVEPHELDKAKK